MINKVLPSIRKAAKSVASRWPGVVTEDDLVNDLVIHFMEAPGALETLEGLPEEKRQKRLVSIGNTKAAAQRDGYSVFSGQVSYSVEDVQKILNAGGLEGHVDGFDVGVADLKEGMDMLQERNQGYYNAVWDRYYAGITPPKGAEAMRLSRATESLTTLMNRISESARYEHRNGGRFRNNRSAVDQVDLDYVGEVRYDD